MKEYVAGFMYVGGWVALVRKAKPEWQAGKLNGIGGLIEPGETPEGAMAREFREETGMATPVHGWTRCLALVGRSGWLVHFFRYIMIAPPDTSYGELPKLTKDGPEPCDWYAVTRLYAENVIPNLRWLVPLCRDLDISFPLTINDRSDPAVNGATMRDRLEKAEFRGNKEPT